MLSHVEDDANGYTAGPIAPRVHNLCPVSGCGEDTQPQIMSVLAAACKDSKTHRVLSVLFLTRALHRYCCFGPTVICSQPSISFLMNRLGRVKENAVRREGVQRTARISVTMPLMLSVSEADYRWHTRISRRPDKLERYGTLSLFNAWRGTSVGYSSSDHSNRINDRCAYGLHMQVFVFPVV